jgi:ribonuclease-3
VTDNFKLAPWIDENIGLLSAHIHFQQALTHRSFSKDNNERLEYLGDAVLDVVIGEALYLANPQADEGDLSRFRALLVQGDTLAEISREIALDSLLRLGAGEEKTGGRARDSILAGAFEALLGAIYLDMGFAACKNFILHLYQQRLEDVNQLGKNKDAKTALQELLQKKQLPLPVYSVIKTEGSQHQQQFFVECHIGNSQFTVQGQGSSKKKAEQQSALNMLEVLKKEKIYE